MSSPRLTRSALQGSPKLVLLHPAERALIAVAGALLVLFPWTFGGMLLWSQSLSLGLAAVALGLALLPRTLDEGVAHDPSVRYRPFLRLMRFPLFWLGLAFALYMAIGALNPAWRYVQIDTRWTIRRLDYISWLPHGVDAPARIMNPWRMMAIYLAPWLLVCALWVGITRRKTARLLVTIVAINGLAIALVLLAQRTFGARKMLWFHPAPASYFVGPFVYKNHGGIFFDLTLAASLGLAWWHAQEAQRRFQKSHPGLLFGLFGGVLLVAVTLTYARAATVLGLLFTAVVSIAFAVWTWRRRAGGRPVVAVLFTVLCLAFLLPVLTSLKAGKAWTRFQRLFNEDEFSSVLSRQLATRATLDMARTSLVTGHGAGSFRFIFPQYQQAYPEIRSRVSWVKKKKIEQRLNWEHAHNDYAEFLAEFGLIGAGFALAALVVTTLGAARARLFSQPALLTVAAAAVLLLTAAALDFPTHCPAVLLTGAALPALALRWAQLERRT